MVLLRPEMRMQARIARLAATAGLLVCAFAAVLWASGPQTIAVAASGLVWWPIVLVLAFLAGGVVLSSLRLKLITADLGYRLSFRDAAITLSAGQLAGTAFFQLAGQLIGRGAVLGRRGIPPAAAVVISGYERMVSMSVSLLLAGCGAVYLFGTLTVDLKSGGAALAKLALGFAVTIMAGAWLAWGDAIRNVARGITPELLLRLLRSLLISLAIQGTTLAAYVALERALAPHVGIVSLAAASCIVMLAASLPISFGGWGLRELSAVVALQAIGLSSASALLTALLIGALSLGVIVALPLVIMAGGGPAPAGGPAAITRAAMPDYTAALDWVLPTLAASAVLFQLHIPTDNDLINVNLADPVVMLGASLFVLRHFRTGWPVWRVPHAGTWLVAATAVIAFGLLRGWLAFGWTDWAFVNKGLGWPILLCYGATGALIVHRAQQRGLDHLAATFAASAAAVAVLDFALTMLIGFGADALRGLVAPRIEGFSQNPNAFALVLCLSLAAAIMLNRRPAASTGLMAAALVGLWFSGSRAGLLAVPVMLAAALAVGASPRLLARAVVIAAAAIASVLLLPSWIEHGAFDLLPMLHQRTDVVNEQHLQSVLDGLAMFAAHPVFGAGIGAYMAERIASTGMPLVIHSTPVWLLAETGLVGFGVFLAAACRLLADAIRRRGEPAARLLLLILCALAVMSSAHEMLYQRAFWLLLGAVLAMPAAAAGPDRRG
jgi:hypothetical protein